MRGEKMYKVVFTARAASAAKASSSLEAVEERVRSEIAAILLDDMALSQLIFHAVEMEDGREYLCRPRQEGEEHVLVVDTCSRDEVQPKSGMFAGETFSFPVADGQARQEEAK
jgi:hypothetical protein